jgi:hypothetical protein
MSFFPGTGYPVRNSKKRRKRTERKEGGRKEGEIKLLE